VISAACLCLVATLAERLLFRASESFQSFALISSFSGCASNPEFEKLLQKIRVGFDTGG
jgi:hypothetical protein